MRLKCCAIIPSYNHSEMIGELVRHVRELGLPVFIIDDGSDRPARAALKALHAPASEVVVERLEANRGKGAAVMRGFDLARAAGFTHALQIDADGQHDLSKLREFIALAESNPDALIAGAPVHDATMPRGRRIARSITHFWVGIETLTTHPVDTMCGLRLYPIEAVTGLQARHRLGRRMDFDVEIFVRLMWEGIPVLIVPVRVVYPRGNLSNFNLVRDNWLITIMHTRLVLGMPLRLRAIIRNRRRSPEASSHWAALTERGAYWGLNFLALLYRATGRYGCMVAVFPIALYFHLTGAEQRRSSRKFLQRAHRAKGIDYNPGWMGTFRHSFGFARKTVDTFAAWLGGIAPGSVVAIDRCELDRATASGQGILLIVSHLGNIEISRALLDDAQRSRIKILVHTVHAQNFARVIRRFRPDAMADTIQVTEMNPGTMIALKEAIERGDWVAIAGDRTPVRGDERISVAPFLGQDAPFPQGPYVLAHLLECPVYLMFCMQQNGGYGLYFEMFAERITLPRRDKQAAISAWAGRYAKRLESFCLMDPFQWYNFFDFWQMPSSSDKVATQ
ncbi:MAG TPA: glycosyltransferase [Candidatus Binataceae bacterium]|nr:glycosyltransferase [Candidatus Binataceae bacterium]